METLHWGIRPAAAPEQSTQHSEEPSPTANQRHSTRNPGAGGRAQAKVHGLNLRRSSLPWVGPVGRSPLRDLHVCFPRTCRCQAAPGARTTQRRPPKPGTPLGATGKSQALGRSTHISHLLEKARFCPDRAQGRSRPPALYRSRPRARGRGAA